MAGTLIHVDESQYSPNSDYADTSSSTSNIYEGDFVTRNGNSVEITDPSNHDDFDGIVPHLDRGDHLPEHDEDYTEPQYEGDGTAANSDRVVYDLPESGALAVGWSPHKDAMTAPDISRGDTVVLILVDGADDAARPILVEDGYSHGGTTYGPSSGTGDYITVGTAEKAVSSRDSLVPVQVE